MLKKYNVKVNGYDTTVLLSDEDAAEQGLLKPAAKKAAETPAKKAPAPANKARKAPNKKG